jgi:hypothetical protein
MAAESVINELDLKACTCGNTSAQMAVIGELQSKIPAMTAERIYRYYMDQDISEEQTAQLAELFFRDEHSIWYEVSKPNSDAEEDLKEELDDENSDELPF